MQLSNRELILDPPPAAFLSSGLALTKPLKNRRRESHTRRIAVAFILFEGYRAPFQYFLLVKPISADIRLTLD
jgi:hypothetical protein